MPVLNQFCNRLCLLWNNLETSGSKCIFSLFCFTFQSLNFGRYIQKQHDWSSGLYQLLGRKHVSSMGEIACSNYKEQQPCSFFPKVQHSWLKGKPVLCRVVHCVGKDSCLCLPLVEMIPRFFWEKILWIGIIYNLPLFFLIFRF